MAGLGALRDFILVAVRPFQEALRRDHGEQPGQLVNLGNITLAK